MKTQNLNHKTCLKNERGLHHGLMNLAWICWIVVELPLALLYYLLLILTVRNRS